MRFTSKSMSYFLSAIALFLLVSVLPAANVQAADDTVNISPVVQLVSYKNIYGKYVEMYGWGSASIISEDGVILSNNHVVDDGKGKLASAFNVCVTQKIKEKPVCNYTATLIARDQTMDVALLKIDPTDIFGNPVDYSKFKTIDIDFNYSPQTQDEVITIGYPWIGSDTITETKGIVSGIAEYNGYRYIKTDALIAGGNSGGAMVNKSGKLIGIPTYTMGGFFDSSLGYGLYIKEAEQFINENIGADVVPKKSDFNFSEYQKTIENINKNLKIEDDLLKFSFSQDYEVKNYIKNRYLDFANRTQKEVSVSVNMELIDLPNLTNEKHFWYYVENLGFYNKEYQNLKQKKVGGMVFYSPVYKSDVSQGNTDYVTLYFAKLSPKLMLKMEVYAPLYDEKLNEKVRTETENVLKGFTFKTDKISQLENGFTFELLSPYVKVATSDMSATNDRNGYYINYLNNLHEYFTVSLAEKNLYSGKGETPEDIYRIETKDSTSDYKSMISFMGHKGYVVCEGYNYYGSFSYGPVYNYYGNYYYQYGGYGFGYGKDENDLTMPAMTNCTIKILDGLEDQDEQEYFMFISVTAAVYNIEDALKATYDYMQKNMKLTPMGQGTTDLVNVYDIQTDLQFNDIGKQNEAYKSFLKLLIKYDLLKNKERYDGDYAMMWKDVVPIYLKAMYNVDLNADAPKCKGNKVCMVKTAKSQLAGQTVNWNDLILNKMKIDLNAYVPTERLYYFDRVLHYRLAGVNLPTFSEKELSEFEMKRMEKEYKTEADKVDAFDFAVYGKRKITLYEALPSTWVSAYQSDFTVSWSPAKGVWMDRIFNDEAYNFNPARSVDELNYADSYKESEKKNEEVSKQFDQCMTTKKVQTCVQNYVVSMAGIWKEQQDSLFTITVLTKAGLYDYMAQNIDFGLFDQELAKKKDSEISDVELMPTDK